MIEASGAVPLGYLDDFIQRSVNQVENYLNNRPLYEYIATFRLHMTKYT